MIFLGDSWQMKRRKQISNWRLRNSFPGVWRTVVGVVDVSLPVESRLYSLPVVPLVSSLL